MLKTNDAAFSFGRLEGRPVYSAPKPSRAIGRRDGKFIHNTRTFCVRNFLPALYKTVQGEFGPEQVMVRDAIETESEVCCRRTVPAGGGGVATIRLFGGRH